MDSGDAPRVLVIDGDPAGRELLVDLLQDAGYRVEAADAPGDASARIREGHYGLVVADVGADPLVGAAKVAQLTRARPGLPALLVSAFPDDAMRARAQLLGMRLLAKPFHAETLLALIGDLMRRDGERSVAP